MDTTSIAFCAMGVELHAFNVRDDELPFFDEMIKDEHLDLTLSANDLTMEMIPTLDPGSGVCIQGMRTYEYAMFHALAERGVHFLTTRTIGYNNLDLNAARSCGVHVANVNYPPNGVADYTVMMILLCPRNYKQALWRTNCNDYSLEGLMGRDMKDLTIGIIGTGKIGAQVARNLSGFGCRLIAYDRHPKEELKNIVTYVDLDTLYAKSDVITVHTALTKDTYHLISLRTLEKMKDGVVLINCARGALMDVEALIRGIETQKIGALGIDCIENEENIVHRNRKTDIFPNRQMAYLRQFKNVVHTQHMAFYTEDAIRSMVYEGIHGLLAMEEGKELKTQLC